MKAIKFSSILLLLTAGLTSCDWHTTRTIIGYGDVESEERVLTDFSGVSLTGTCDVYISTGENFYVELQAQAQVLEVMTTSVRSGILNIGFNPDFNIKTDQEISAIIVVPSLDFVSITGLGDFEISGEKQPKLDIHNRERQRGSLWIGSGRLQHKYIGGGKLRGEGKRHAGYSGFRSWKRILQGKS